MRRPSVVQLAVAAVTLFALPGGAWAQVYCQAEVGNYSADVDPNGRGDLEISNGPIGCAATATYTSAVPDNVSGGTKPYGGASEAFADLSSGMLRVGVTDFIGSIADSNASSLASWRENLSVTSPAPLWTTMTVMFDGAVGPAGLFSLRLIVEGSNNVINDNLTYRGSGTYGDPFSSALSEGSSYDGFGTLTVPIYLSGGGTIDHLLIDLSASASGNADFGHTVGLQFIVPDEVTYTSSSGVFLTAPQDPISGGVTFDGNLSDFLPSGSQGVPEPGSWSLMILGLGATGLILRRRQKAAARLVPVA